MFAHKLDADKFFARIRNLDMECPRCGAVHHCNGITGPYRSQTGRFKCPGCKVVLAIGVIAYPVTTTTRQHETPDDWVPDARQALALRNQNPGLAAMKRRSPLGPRNIVLREGCRCLPKGTALVVHPACPIHGSDSTPSEGTVPAAAPRR